MLVLLGVECVVIGMAGRRVVCVVCGWPRVGGCSGLGVGGLGKARVVRNGCAAVCLGLVGVVDVVVFEWCEAGAVLVVDRRGLRVVAVLAGCRAFRVFPRDL